MNETQQAEDKIENKKVGILLAFGILILPWIFSWFTLRKGYSTTAKVIAFSWMVLFLGWFKQSGQNSSHNEHSSNSVGKIDPQKVEYIKESCLAVSEKFGASSPLSDIQRKESWKDYRGKAFEWNMQVGEVHERTFGSGYNVQFKCRGSNSFISDVTVSYPQSDKNMVLQLQKGSVYNVKGILSDYSSLLGLTADFLETK